MAGGLAFLVFGALSWFSDPGSTTVRVAVDGATLFLRAGRGRSFFLLSAWQVWSATCPSPT